MRWIFLPDYGGIMFCKVKHKCLKGLTIGNRDKEVPTYSVTETGRAGTEKLEDFWDGKLFSIMEELQVVAPTSVLGHCFLTRERAWTYIFLSFCFKTELFFTHASRCKSCTFVLVLIQLITVIYLGYCITSVSNLKSSLPDCILSIYNSSVLCVSLQ